MVMNSRSTEIVFNEEGTVYHLNIRGDDLADDILLVGDPGRARMIAGMLSGVEKVITNREFVTATGSYNGKRVSVIATGIGVDNMDIVLNEIHVAANFNRATGEFRNDRVLNLVRIGTSGGLHEDIEPGSVVLTEYAIGIDGLFGYYSDVRKVLDEALRQAFVKDTGWPASLPPPYVAGCSYSLANRLDIAEHKGITITAPGFYAPQGRHAALLPAFPDLNRRMAAFRYKHFKVLNFEMESSALYALGRSLGHKTLTLCLVVANRERGEFMADYKPAMETLIEKVLNGL